MGVTNLEEKVTFRPFDLGEMLDTEGDIARFLENASMDGDAAAIALALGIVARARNMSQLGRDVGITRMGLFTALAPGGKPSPDTVAKVAKALEFGLALRSLPTSGSALGAKRAAE